MIKETLTFQDAIKHFNYNYETGVLKWLVPTAYRVNIGDEAGCINSRGHLQTMINGRFYQVHRIVWLICTGEFPKNNIDHIDKNKLNNKFSNLRDVTQSENCKNQSIRSDNKSGTVGIDKIKSGWRAQIQVNKTKINLGLFKNKQDATLAREQANIKYNFHPNHGKEK